MRCSSLKMPPFLAKIEEKGGFEKLTLFCEKYLEGVVRHLKVENLKIVSGNVSWIYNNKNINIKIEDAFYASENGEMKLIQINSGKKYIDKKVFYYDFSGNLVLYYDLEVGIIEWFFEETKRRLIINDLIQVGFFPQLQRVFILCDCDKQELQGYAIDGKCLFKVSNPPDFEMRYFVKMKDEIAVVCDGNQNQQDAYGRFHFSYIIDIDSGKLTKGSLAY